MQEYGFLIIVMVVVWAILLTTRFDAYLKSKNKGNEVVEKACPPHSWDYEEQVGMEGTFYIRCQRCRRLPGWEDKV